MLGPVIEADSALRIERHSGLDPLGSSYAPLRPAVLRPAARRQRRRRATSSRARISVAWPPPWRASAARIDGRAGIGAAAKRQPDQAAAPVVEVVDSPLRSTPRPPPPLAQGRWQSVAMSAIAPAAGGTKRQIGAWIAAASGATSRSCAPDAASSAWSAVLRRDAGAAARGAARRSDARPRGRALEADRGDGRPRPGDEIDAGARRRGRQMRGAAKPHAGC